MKGALAVISVALVAYVAASPCIIKVPADPAPLTGPCYNPQYAFYTKFPLLYKIQKFGCNLFCKKVNGVNTCPPAPAAAPQVVVPAAPQVLVPAAPQTIVTPEVLNTLLAYNGVASNPAPQLLPALSCGCS